MIIGMKIALGSIIIMLVSGIIFIVTNNQIAMIIIVLCPLIASVSMILSAPYIYDKHFAKGDK